MFFGLRETAGHVPSSRLGVVVLIAMTACTAALVAHIGIDIAGDYVLAHDTYDNIAHGSRLLVTGTALITLAVVAMCLLSSALDRAARLPAVRTAAEAAPAYRSIVPFLIAAVAVTFVFLAGMEYLDLRVAGAVLDDWTDLLGGSAALSIAITVPTAVVLAVAGWRVARWIPVAHRIVVRILRVCSIARGRIGGAMVVVRRRRPNAFAIFTVPRSTSKRGPPLLSR